MIQLLLAVIYLSYVSLGLPDSLLGSAWPSMYVDMNVPLSYAGIISMIISVGTIISSLCSDTLTRKLGAGRVTAISVATTAVALFGFSVSPSFPVLCLCAIPYGLGAGGVDAALNNYVALHYSSRHMSWLHGMWGAGTIIGPTIMGAILTGGRGWQMGYRCISFLQIGLSVILVLSLPLWKKKAAMTALAAADPSAPTESGPAPAETGLSPRKVLRIRGAKEVMITFFCYCALEQTAMLWAGSYFTLQNGLSEETAALCASVFSIGITAGRFINGFLTAKFSDAFMIRVGCGLIGAGVLTMFIPAGAVSGLVGISLIGLGCAPIYPCVIHASPSLFGAERSQALIGVEMASAYVGTCLMPPLFGLIANHIHIGWLPVYLLVILALMVTMHERLVHVTARHTEGV